MSTPPENEFDLEKLFLPAWAQEPSSTRSYAQYQGETERPDRRDDRRGPRPPNRQGASGPRRDGPRPQGDRRSGPRPEGGRGQPRDGGRGERPGFRRDEPNQRREPPPPLPDVSVSLLPDEKGVESLSRQIKMAGRAYPLFDIAQMILQKPERHTVAFAVNKNPEGRPIQPLFVCALDDTLWLSEDEAIAHVLQKHFETFYQAERTATEAPKGKYTFVAQCGMSGVILGPPNHHDYQNQLHKLHTERYSRMPFEMYKSRVRIVREEEVVKKWVDDQSWKTEYLCLNLPEPLRLPSREAVEKHFRETHKESIIKSVEAHALTGPAARALRSPGLSRLVRSAWEDQRRFPLQIATVLSQQFARQGLQFFKVNKTVTHVSVARPTYLDLEATPVSEGIKRIVLHIVGHPKTTRRHLLDALAPAPPIPVLPVATPIEGQAAPTPPANEPTPEQTAVIADLHWLVHQGHVIEFANGILEAAKKPLPRPPKPEPAPEKRPPAAVPTEAPVAESPAVAGVEAPSEAIAVAATAAGVETTAAAEIPADVGGSGVPERSPEPSPGLASEVVPESAATPATP